MTNLVDENQERTEKMIATKTTQTKRYIIKNLILISSSIMTLFVASQSMDKLQSSVHHKGSIGTYALASLNVCNVLGSLLLSACLIKRFGAKYVLLVSMLSYVAYIAANFDSSGYSLIPLAAVNGIGCSTLYTALWTYIGTLGSEFSNATGIQLDIVYARFYGLFFVFTQSASIWGNLITFEVLKRENEDKSSEGNCGVNFCDGNVSDKSTNFEGPPKNFNVLCGIFVFVSILAILILMFIDRQDHKSPKEGFTFSSLLVTGRKLLDPFMLLATPITIYGGLQLSFIVSDYTKAYITCEFGVANVGYIFICFGAVSTVFCAVSGLMVKVIGRKGVFIVAALLDIGVYFALAFHDYRGQQGLWLLFVIIGVMAVTQGVWQAQVKALYGILFPDCQEVAFSVLGTVEALGLAIGFFYSSFVCTQIKLWVLLAVLFLGMICYGLVEFLYSKKNSDENRRSGSAETVCVENE